MGFKFEKLVKTSFWRDNDFHLLSVQILYTCPSDIVISQTYEILMWNKSENLMESELTLHYRALVDMHLVWLRDTHEWSWREMKSTRTSLDGTWVDWAHTDLYWLSIEKINQHNQPSQSIKPCPPAPLFFLKSCGFKLKTIKRLLAREKTNEQVKVSLILNLIGREDGVIIMNHSQKCTNFNSRTNPVFSTF